MKTILMALAVTAIAGVNAEAQTIKTKSENCGVNAGHVCKMSPDRNDILCYKTDYAQNFPVCKGTYGYYICCNKSDKLRVQRPPVEGKLVKATPVDQEKRAYCTRGRNGNIIACSYGYAGPYEYRK